MDGALGPDGAWARRRRGGRLTTLRLEAIAKRFGDQTILDGISLEIAAGEVLALLGPSGSGKTTLLRIVAGFERADAGTVRLGDERIDPLPPERRGFGMVFQHYALFPHMTVGANVAFGLGSRRLAKAAIAERVAAALARVDLAGFERRKVAEISGGQQQRVAVARALAPEPRVLLLDEPLSNLDPGLRERTRRELATTLSSIGITTLLVTHEQEEAFELGARVALLHRGHLAQVAPPAQLYRAPATRFVAGFVGRASFVPVEVIAVAGERARVRGDLPGGELELPVAGRVAVGDSAEAMFRPEQLALLSPDAAEAVAGEVTGARFAGALTFVRVRTGGGAGLEVAIEGVAPAPGARVRVGLRRGAAPRLFPRETPA